MALICCPECTREISDKAASCPHCGMPVRQQDVVIKGIDPFAQYHTPIQGKKNGKLSILGRIGVYFIGPFFVFSGLIAMFHDKKPAQGIATIVLAVSVSTGCYLWARSE